MEGWRVPGRRYGPDTRAAKHQLTIKTLAALMWMEAEVVVPAICLYK